MALIRLSKDKKERWGENLDVCVYARSQHISSRILTISSRHSVGNVWEVLPIDIEMDSINHEITVKSDLNDFKRGKTPPRSRALAVLIHVV